jgi:hypothetical protein
VANTILTPTQVTRKALAILHNKLKFIKTIDRQYDSQYARQGAKIGTSLSIRMPNQFTVRSGATLSTQDVTESSQALTLATQRGVDINFSSVELTMSLDDFAARILEPAMSRLAAEVEYIVLSNVYKDIYNLTAANPDNEPDAILDVLRAHARVSQGLAPEGNRHFILDSATMFPLVNSLSTYFHKASELERAFAEGYIGMAGGVKWWESNMVPSHTNGTRTDATPLVNTSTGITSGTATIAITGLGATVTVKQGDVFTVADVYAVNPETKQRYSHLQPFVATADGTASSGSLTVSVSPTPTTSGASQNVELVSAGASKAVVFTAAGGSGDASQVYIQPLLYHRDAFAFVTADLEMPKGVDFAARETHDGISLRIVRQYDITEDKFPCRIDVLFGYKTLRPEWAARVRG